MLPNLHLIERRQTVIKPSDAWRIMEKMKPEVLFFGIAREIAGEKAVIEVAENITVGELQDFLKNKYPRLKELTSFLIAVNQAYVSPNTMIRHSDEIAVIPPVSGG